MNAHAAIGRNHSHGKRELGARTSSIRLAAPEDGVLDEMLGRAGDAIPTGIATEILRIVFRHRRLRQAGGGCVANPCPSCLAPHVERVKRFVLAGEPVHFVLPAFPGEVTQPAQDNRAAARSGRGARPLVPAIGLRRRGSSPRSGCQDHDLFGRAGVQRHRRRDRRGGDPIRSEDHLDRRSLGAGSLDFFSLEDLFETTDFEAMRAHLVERYAEPLAGIRERTRTEEAHRVLFCGVLRFLLEDRMGQGTRKTKSRLQKECKADAYRMIQRSNAWSGLVAHNFPDAVRLSIHPQEVHSEKIGIRLGETPDAWLTPWHSAVLKSQERFRLVHREEAEALGARLVYRSGHPSHYELAA